jgi:thiamine-monophosphate kinase
MREIKLINDIQRWAGKPGKGVIAGIGDDCAVLEYAKDKYLLWAADMLVEGTHFTASDAGYEKIGRKAVAVNLSDIAAMGGVPKYIIVSIGLPKEISTRDVKRMYDGITGICAEYGVKVIGGDTNRSERIVIDVSIIGFVEKKRLMLRSGAKTGDLILVTGPMRSGRRSHLDFEPRVREARRLTARYKINSMMDVSDGIGPDLGRMCASSGVGAKVYAGSVPLSKGMSLEDALHYGESFELLFTMGPKEAARLFENAAKRKKFPGVYIIGEILSKGSGVKLVGKDGKVSPLKMEGFRHF